MLTTLLILATITFVSMMSPGPDMLLIVKYSGGKTRIPALTCIAGICAGLSVHVAFSILGIATVIAASATLYTVMKFAGAGYLIYIGLKSLFSKGEMTFEKNNKLSSNQKTKAFRDGLLCNVLNPKVTIFILAVFTQFIEPSTPTYEKVIYGFAIIIEAFVVWNLFVFFIRTKFVLTFMQKFQLVIERVVGLFLVGVGSALIFDES